MIRFPPEQQQLLTRNKGKGFVTVTVTLHYFTQERERERESAREGGAGIPLSHQVADGPTPRLSFFIANLNESHGSHRALPVASAILGIGLLFSCSL